MSEIRDWLESLELGRYAAAFEANDIDWDVLPQLDHSVLKDIGVESAGARLRILKAVAALAPDAAADGDKAAARPQAGGRSGALGDAERRHLTIMFCDLVGSTALAEAMDLEEYRELLAEYHAVSEKAIERYDGYVARYMGDGLLVYFGYPRAHEDDAERAVRAGLDIVEAVAALKPRHGVELRVRIGVASGLVVAGDIVGAGASEERAVLGDAPSLAARLQGLAEPGAVLISDSTRALTGKLFACENAGRHALKGFSGEVQAWRVLSEASTESRFEATRSPRGTPMVGRDTEVLLLLDRWERACADEGQVVLLSGEPGIGKSRLVHALRERIGSVEHEVYAFQCSPHHVNSAFYPFIDHVRRTARIARTDSMQATLDKLAAWLAERRGTTQEAAALLASLLSIPIEGRPAESDLGAQQQKQRIIETLAARFTAGAGGKPALIVFEDAHWADASTLEAMTTLIDGVPGTATLAVITHRPEFAPPWQGRGHVTAHSLGRLGRRQVTALVEGLVGGRSLSSALLAEVVAKTDGVPLFVEELTKAVLESEVLDSPLERRAPAGTRRPLSVPSTLQDLLVARLDRLGEVKDVAQMASIIGREFSFALLAELWSERTSDLRGALAELERAELIYGRGTPPNATYTFKHALVQDAAYESLLRGDRARLHARLSEVLESRFPETAAQVPELLAHHCTAAGRIGAALEYWMQAADLALGRSAYVERLAHLDSALHVARGLSDREERRRWELELELARGGALMATKGYRAAETGEAFARARDLADDAGDARRRFAALRGLHGVYYSRGEHRAALDAAEACLAIGAEGGDGEHGALAHRLVGQTLLVGGKLAEARAHLERALALGASGDSSEVAALTGGGHRLMAPMFLAQALWLQGFADQALDRARGALEEAERRYGAFAVTTNMFFYCLILGWRREYTALSVQAERVRRLAGEHAIHDSVSEGGLIADWPRLAAGAPGEGAALARRRVDAVRALGGVMTPFKLGVLAEALIADDAGEALDVVEEALALAAGGEHWSDAELMRIKGKALLARDQAEAEKCFEASLRVAREQGARSWELRAAIELAGLWRARGEGAAAGRLLAPIYESFSEAFDTADLEDAKALLDALGAPLPSRA